MNPIKLDFSSDIYQFGEDISAARLHAKLFNVISSKINIIVNTEGNKKLDRIGFTKKFQELYPYYQYQTAASLGHDGKDIESLIEEDKSPSFLRAFDDEDACSFVAVDIENKRVFKFSDKLFTICYDISDFIEVQKLLLVCQNLLNSCIKTANSVAKVNVITYDGQDFELVSCKINSNMPIDYDKHYNDDFKPIAKKIDEFIESIDSGLIIAHGVAGTGKTTYLRHLMTHHNKKFIILSNALMNNIADPSFIKFILEQKDSILILEDCEQLLQDRKNNAFNNGIANILNMTDGLYSDILNIKIIATFNADIKDIDQALLRKGRLVAKYEFGLLSADKTKTLMKELNKSDDHPTQMTLADIYNFKDITGGESVSRKKIGF